MHVGCNRDAFSGTESVELFGSFFTVFGRSGRDVNLKHRARWIQSHENRLGGLAVEYCTLAPFFTNPTAIFRVQRGRVVHVSSRPHPHPKAPENRRTNEDGHAPFYQYHDFRQLSARLYRRHRRDFERRRRTWLWIQGKVWPESTPHGTAKARGFGQEPVPRMRKARDITKLRGKKRPT